MSSLSSALLINTQKYLVLTLVKVILEFICQIKKRLPSMWRKHHLKICCLYCFNTNKGFIIQRHVDAAKTLASTYTDAGKKLLSSAFLSQMEKDDLLPKLFFLVKTSILRQVGLSCSLGNQIFELAHEQFMSTTCKIVIAL